MTNLGITKKKVTKSNLKKKKKILNQKKKKQVINGIIQWAKEIKVIINILLLQEEAKLGSIKNYQNYQTNKKKTPKIYGIMS